ncbi:putative secreted protein, partial [Rhodopirellula maiorica SM1]
MSRFLLSAAFIVTLAVPSYAHKVWLRPSQTVLSGAEPWVTVDAAVSNDLFYFNHFPLKLDGLVITAPDGEPVEGQNLAVGKYRSVFDLPLTQQGTYRIAVVNDGAFASYEHGGERHRLRGNAASLEKEIPADATNVRVTESIGRIETFVTNGAPSDEALQPTGKGIELIPITHPNDLYAGEE